MTKLPFLFWARESHIVSNISSATAWRTVKRVSEKLYPHFFRLNRVSHFLEDPETSTAEMMIWFGSRSAKTVDKYVGYSRRHILAMSSRFRKETKVRAGFNKIFLPANNKINLRQTIISKIL